VTLQIPSNISINAETDEGLALGRRYVAQANAMLVGLQARQQGGVSIVGQTRTMPDGTTIKVGFADNDVSRMGWVQIDVPPAPRVIEKKFERLEERSDYIWIGLKTVSGGKYVQLCPDDDPDEQIGWPILWVWEPPDGAEPPGILSAWREMLTLYHEPVIPEPLEPFNEGPGTFVALPSGAYIIHRYPEEPGILSPLTAEEDGDDLWEQVFVMDPGDGQGVINAAVLFDKEPFDADALAINSALASIPTYLMPDDPNYVDSENQPKEREERHPAKVIFAPDPDWEPPEGEEDQQPPAMPYLAKVFYLAPKCDEVTPIHCKLKIISGKMPLTTIDRYEFTIERGNWKPRAALPRGVYDDNDDWKGNSIPAGDNVMDHGWSTETWEVRPTFGSRIADEKRMPFGLNPGQLEELECTAPVAFGIAINGRPRDFQSSFPPYTTIIHDVYVTMLGIAPESDAYWMGRYQPQDRCGNYKWGGSVGAVANAPADITVYDTVYQGPTINASWVPSEPNPIINGTKAVTIGVEFYSETWIQPIDPGESKGWQGFYFYLPLTNEWVETHPHRAWDEVLEWLYHSGYAYLASTGLGELFPTFPR
jgi:hypothetical protein